MITIRRQYAAIYNMINLKQCVEEELKKNFIGCNTDIIISKGQGNFKSLSEEKGIFFLLKAKCPMIANRLQVDLNSYVFVYSGD